MPGEQNCISRQNTHLLEPSVCPVHRPARPMSVSPTQMGLEGALSTAAVCAAEQEAAAARAETRAAAARAGAMASEPAPRRRVARS